MSVPSPRKMKVSTERLLEAIAAGHRFVGVGPTDRQLAARLKIQHMAVRNRVRILERRGIVRPVFEGYALTDGFAKRLPETFDKMDAKRQQHFLAKALSEWEPR
jgi:predicted transcriptional regulator